MPLMHSGDPRGGPTPLRDFYAAMLDHEIEYERVWAAEMLALVEHLDGRSLMFGDSIMVAKRRPAFIDSRSGRSVSVTAMSRGRHYELSYDLLPGESPWPGHMVRAAARADGLEEAVEMLTAIMAFFALHPAPPRDQDSES